MTSNSLRGLNNDGEVSTVEESRWVEGLNNSSGKVFTPLQVTLILRLSFSLSLALDDGRWVPGTLWNRTERDTHGPFSCEASRSDSLAGRVRRTLYVKL